MAGLIISGVVALFLGYNVWTHRHMAWLRFHYLPVTLPDDDRKVQPYYSLYPKLTDSYKRKFHWRAFYFLHTTTIKFYNFEQYTKQDQQKIRLLLASVAAQMTLFLPEKCFMMIHTIMVYPKAYYSKSSRRFHKGETNPKAGVIALSWTGIAEGIESSTDGLNLIIHEYAHALWFEHVFTSYETFDNDAADRFQKVAMQELQAAGEKEDHFFRDYGLSNFHEFVAVAAENFFERPHPFEKALPHVYEAMVALYRHDPIRIS